MEFRKIDPWIFMSSRRRRSPDDPAQPGINRQICDGSKSKVRAATDVMILKIFSQKNCEKIGVFDSKHR
jgi:hypothetical protein